MKICVNVKLNEERKLLFSHPVKYSGKKSSIYVQLKTRNVVYVVFKSQRCIIAEWNRGTPEL